MNLLIQIRSWYAQFSSRRNAGSFLAVSLSALTILAVSVPGISYASMFPDESDDIIAAQIEAGEFAAAIRSAAELPRAQADMWMSQISAEQYSAGATTAAFDSVASIQGDLVRTKTLSSIASYGRPSHNDADTYDSGNSPETMSGGSGDGGFGGFGGGTGGASGNNQGGVTINDFQPLMELIKQTIAPDTWTDSNGEGTLTAYPSGVFVDGSGLMKRIESGPVRNLDQVRNSSLADSGNRRWTVDSDLRKISLTRLEKAAQLAAAQGVALDDEMLNLAGMYEIHYLILVPESNDIVIAGPAGPWIFDAEGRRLNRKTGKPVLQLDDLVVCLRNAFEDNGTFGCSINPRADNLTQTKNFIEQSDLKGQPWRDGLQQALGRQDVEVFGIDPQTHAGYVLVEADYRMKLVGMGLEPSIASIPSYLSRVELDAAGQLPPLDVVRWWFTLNYDDVTADKNREVFAFTGTGVKVLSENEMLDQQGQRVHTGQTFGPTREFAEDFTEHFNEIADRYPVYRQLKNVFDMAIVSSLVNGQGLADKADWHLTYFGSDDSYGPVYQPALKQTPREVDSVMNHREIRERKERTTLKHTIVGVSGGVHFTAAMATADEKISTDSSLEETARQIGTTSDDSLTWWWD